jgi:hypothetical protein
MLLLVLILVLSTSAVFAADSPSGQETGMRIYRDGLLPSGAVLRGVLRNGAELSGADAACVKCHRRSGLGGGEGQKTIRPIAGRLLFTRPAAPATQRARVRPEGAQARPPYTVETLARALREGIDPAGRSLDELMPRFDMSDADVAQLASYLKSLPQTTAPGVSESEIHFATVVTPGGDPFRTKAMLKVMEAYFADKNAGTRGEGKRKAIGREQMYRSYRTWVLHVWKLEGLPETWTAQLEAHYRKQPVFAMLSGIGAGTWRPVHEFCERTGLPCLFPNVDYPVISETDYASIYFSRGIVLEAEVLARHLADVGRNGQSGPIVQVFRDDATGRVPAQAFRTALRRSGINDVSDHPVAGDRPVPSTFWSRLLQETQPGVLVLWLKDEDITHLHGQGKAPPGMENVYLSGSLIARPCRVLLFGSWLDRMRLVYPFELTERRAQRLARMNHWLEARKIPLLDERIQSSTYFALTVAGDALSGMGDNFSRDYFIERIEQMTEQSPASAVYPRLSLGPGQRFASRGSYVARFPGEGENMLVPVSEWIVP